MSPPVPERKRDEIVRYAPATRINHWIVAISFVLLALSGLAMFHPAMFWLTNLFGGGPWTRILHPFIGLVMVAAFALLGAKMWRDNRLHDRDWRWLKRIRDVVGNHEENAPEVGRYNAGQKLIYWTIVICLPVLLVSGVVIWRSYFAQYFPIEVIRAAALVHAFTAFVLICAIVVHIYAAIWIKGSVRAMTRGTVSYGWAWKHHRLWFRDVVRGEAPPK
jgi:formate dehydrogenase subunit gamma